MSVGPVDICFNLLCEANFVATTSHPDSPLGKMAFQSSL